MSTPLPSMGALAYFVVFCMFVAGSQSTNHTGDEMESRPTLMDAFYESLCKSVPDTANSTTEVYILLKEFNVTATCYDSTINESSMPVCFNRSQSENCRARVYQEKEFYHVPVNGSFDETVNDIEEYGLLMCIGDCGPQLNKNASNFKKFKSTNTRWSKIYGVYLKITCSVAYLVLFCLVPVLKNPAGYNVASMSLAYLLGCSILVVDLNPPLKPSHPHYCFASAVIKYYLIMVTFFSLNAMSFEIWRALKRSTKNYVLSNTKKGFRKCLWCFVYAWCTPVLPVLISVLVDASPTFVAQINPQYGRRSICWFTSIGGRLLFVSLPILTLVICNTILFVLCVLLIRQGTMKCKEGDTKQSGIRASVYLRLGMMMGGARLLSTTSALLARWTDKMIYWYIFDIFTTMQGVVVFLVFACNKHVYNYFRCREEGSKTSSEESAHRNKKTSATALSNNPQLQVRKKAP